MARLMDCLLCQYPSLRAFEVQQKPPGHYFHCPQCDLIFREPRERLRAEVEKERYDMHENVASEGYTQLFLPLIQSLEDYAQQRGLAPEEVKILDFGCGPTAYLSKLLAEKNFEVANYDIFYFTNQSPLQRTYDVILSTEVWEHFYHPREEIEQLTRLLNPGGMLGIMTAAHRDLEHFKTWHYRRDPTHVSFFSEKTMEWVAQSFRLSLVKAPSPLWVFNK